MCNYLHSILNVAKYHEYKYTDLSFRSYPRSNTKYYEEKSDSDEEQYTHSINSRPSLYKRFEDAKDIYVHFAMQLNKFYEETKRAAHQLVYLYSTVFRLADYDKFEIHSMELHLGFFYEIVLSDPDIMVHLKLTLTRKLSISLITDFAHTIPESS